MGDRVLRSGDRQDGAENRPDARRPAERERQAHHIGAPQADRLRHRQPALLHQERDRRDAEEMQPHDDDDDAGDFAEHVGIGVQHRAEHAGAGAKRHEHRGEAEHEDESRDHGLAPHARGGFRIGKAFQRRAGQIDQIGRHQRQHAGRQEAQHAREQRREYRDVRHNGCNAPGAMAIARRIASFRGPPKAGARNP